MRFVALTVAVAAVFAAAAPSQGALLNLTAGTPDVASGFIAVDYNASSGLFTASGFTQNLNLPPSFAMNQRLFSITAIISNAGTIAGPGSLTVRGDFGGVDQLLFQSNTILAFGFGVSNKFEFLYRMDSGSLGPAGATIGTILVDPNLSFPGGSPDFHSSFSGRIFPGGPGAANADTFLPSPSAAGLAGALSLASLRRRRR